MGRISFIGVPTVEWGYILRNREECARRGYPRATQQKKRDGRLAVVGGGPSAPLYLDKIRQCNEVWAINGAYQMLARNGIEATLYAMDPDPIVVKWCEGVKRALLCDRVCVEAFDALRDAEITVFSLINDAPDGVITGSSTATGAFSLGALLGWAHIDFFGCESSFDGETHAYQDERREELLWVEVDGVEYKTAPDFYMQACELSMPLREFPRNYRAFGGGLLEALTKNPKHDIPFVSRKMLENMNIRPEECESSQ